MWGARFVFHPDSLAKGWLPRVEKYVFILKLISNWVDQPAPLPRAEYMGSLTLSISQPGFTPFKRVSGEMKQGSAHFTGRKVEALRM